MSRAITWLPVVIGSALAAAPATLPRAASEIPRGQIVPLGELAALPALRAAAAPSELATEKPRPPDGSSAALPGGCTAPAPQADSASLTCASGARGAHGTLPGIGCRGPPARPRSRARA